MTRKIQVHQVDAFTRERFTGNPAGVVLNADGLAEAQMLADFDSGMRAAVAKGMGRDEIIRNVRFEKYKDVRNYYRMNLFITSYYHFLTTGKPENAYP